MCYKVWDIFFNIRRFLFIFSTNSKSLQEDPITAMLEAMEIPSKFEILCTVPKKNGGKQSKVTKETNGSSSSGSDENEDESIDLESDSTSLTQRAITAETNVTQFSRTYSCL